MVTTVDKAWAGLITNAVVLGQAFGWDFSQWENLAITIGGALLGFVVVWAVPNRPSA